MHKILMCDVIFTLIYFFSVRSEKLCSMSYVSILKSRFQPLFSIFKEQKLPSWYPPLKHVDLLGFSAIDLNLLVNTVILLKHEQMVLSTIVIS